MRIALIGFGEVGSRFARDLREAGITEIAAWDIAFPQADSPQRTSAESLGGIDIAAGPVEAVGGADIVFVAVTAAATLDALRSLEGGLSHHPFVVDVNSVAPSTKQEGAGIVEAAGGRYVEAAVMSAIGARGLRTPILLGGPHAAAFLEAVRALDMDLTVKSATVGVASSVKMCRSIMIKGTEALVTECLLAARHYGVEREVLASLGDMLPHPDWEGQARYFITRALQHGRRRAEEMREVARTVADAGFEPLLSRAIAERQDWSADRAASMSAEEKRSPDLGRLLDALTAANERSR
jgi:3-hydroxyisobutyrate dehydrogenase